MQAIQKNTKLSNLRSELKRKNLDGIIVPGSDEHRNEELPLYARRLAWLTDFTGSAGTAIILKNRAALFVDGRYTLQASLQVDSAQFEVHHSSQHSLKLWLASLPNSTQLGYDPWLHTIDEIEELTKACAATNSHMVKVDKNPIDLIWDCQPDPPTEPMQVYSNKFAGETAFDKRKRLAASIVNLGAQEVVLTALDSIAWILNIRGNDLEYTPVSLAYAILHDNGKMILFTNTSEISDEVRSHLGADVVIEQKNMLGSTLDSLGNSKRRVLIDKKFSPSWIFDRLNKAGAIILNATDPCTLPKACKNDIEINGVRKAHQRDGLALTQFLYWIKQQVEFGNLTELKVIKHINDLRSKNRYFRGLSFPTIAGSGPNGAIVHYRATQQTNRHFQKGELLLLDSGAQYLDGTTDVTRTISLGSTSSEQRDRFTRVLRGHIALAKAKFVRGTTGSQLDILARLPLWEIGLDFDHGTGHGVGTYLNVHEGPQRISKAPNNVPLRTGMVLSNEPGYYKEGEYGIRTENLVLVTNCDQRNQRRGELLQFETLTLAPIDRSLIDVSMMEEEDLAWLDSYHSDVYDKLSPMMDKKIKAWLREETRPIKT